MDTKTEDKVRRLTTNQARALKAIVFPTVTETVGTVSGASISVASGISGTMLGGTISSLERNNIIRPMGRDGRVFRWELTDNDLIEAKKTDPVTLHDLITKVGGEK